jgi:hydroxymethylpyrimidine pyrophosphatase-like HAD family hydrolase
MDYKIVFSDIDGTLLNKDRELSPATIEADKTIERQNPLYPYLCPYACGN